MTDADYRSSVGHHPFAHLGEEERLQQIAEILATGAIRYLRRQDAMKPAVQAASARREIWEMVDDELEKQILRFLQQHVSLEPNRIRAALGLSAMTLGRRLSRLRNAGLICVVGRTRRARYELAACAGRN